MRDTLSTTVTRATETAQSHITSTVKSQAHCIRGEIRSLGDIQREHAAQIFEKLQDIKGYYKGQVRVVLIKHVYLLFVGPRTFPRGYLLRKARVSFKA